MPPKKSIDFTPLFLPPWLVWVTQAPAQEEVAEERGRGIWPGR